MNPVNGQALANRAGGINKTINHTGDPFGDGSSQSSRDPNSHQNYTGALADTFNSTSQMMLQSGTDLNSVFARGTQELHDAVLSTSRSEQGVKLPTSSSSAAAAARRPNAGLKPQVQHHSPCTALHCVRGLFWRLCRHGMRLVGALQDEVGHGPRTVASHQNWLLFV